MCIRKSSKVKQEMTHTGGKDWPTFAPFTTNGLETMRAQQLPMQNSSEVTRRSHRGEQNLVRLQPPLCVNIDPDLEHLFSSKWSPYQMTAVP